MHTYVHTNVDEVPRGLPLRRAPDGDAARRGRRALDLLPGREAHLRPGEPLPPARAADREAADDRRLHLPPLARPAVRAPAQRPRLHRQLRQHDVRDRRPARAEPGAAARARDPPDPARRPRAELLDERRAQRRLVARRPVLGRLGRHRRALRAAARRRQRGRAADARRDRRRQERPGVHRGASRTAAPGRADGLRPPRLQELRPAREADQAGRRPGLRARPASTRSSRSRSSSSGSRSRTSTSSRASSTRTSTSTPA